MRARKRNAAIVASAGLFMLAAALAAHLHPGPPGLFPVINPGSPQSERLMKGWKPTLERRWLAEWGASRRLELEEDSGPVVDNIAACVAPRGSSVQVGGLARGVRYRAWIDFVRFRHRDDGPVTSLRILASAPGAEPRIIASLVPGDVARGPHPVDIPPEVSAFGEAELTFVELARVPGSWCAWDIIVSIGRDLPARDSLPAGDTINLEIKDRIVQ